MSVSASDYCTALGRIDRADRRIAELAMQLARFAGDLAKYPGDTCFFDIEDEPSPRLDQLLRGARWHASEFPTAEQIQAALRERLESRASATRIWDALSPSQRSGAPSIPA